MTKAADEIERTCNFIAENPGIGQARPDLRPGIRFLPVRNYLIFYCEVPEGAHVIRVIHGARKYSPEHLKRE